MSASKQATKAGSTLVDTSAVIALFRGNERARKCFNEAAEICLPVTALAELFCGLRKCAIPEKEAQRIEDLRSRITLLAHDEETARTYAEIYTDLEAKGTLIPSNDVWIAALALRCQMPLVARDVHFRRIPGLDLIDLADESV